MERTPEDNAVEKALSEEKSGNKGWWIKTILLLALVVLSIVLLFTLGDHLAGEEDPQRSFIHMLKGINYSYLALLLAIVVFYILVESSKYAYMLKIYTGKFRFRIAVKTMFLGKYYDGITPLSTGGQPFQIYYLHKKGIPGGTAGVIPIARYLVYSICMTILSVVMLSIAPRYLPPGTVKATALSLSWVSLGINILFPVTIVLFSLFPKPSKKCILFIVSLLSRLHIVKRKYTVSIKFVREMQDYSNCLKQFWKSFYKFIPLIFLSILECLLFVTLPFFVVLALGNIKPDFNLVVQIACLVIISRYSSLLIPTPGNTGAMEAASSLVFSTVEGIGAVLGWTVLVWRFLTYYVYILSGIGINIFEVVRSAVKKRRDARRKAEPPPLADGEDQ